MCHNVAEGNKKYYEVLFPNTFSYRSVIWKKSGVTIVNEAGDEEKQSLVVHRYDSWTSTSKCEQHRH